MQATKSPCLIHSVQQVRVAMKRIRTLLCLLLVTAQGCSGPRSFVPGFYVSVVESPRTEKARLLCRPGDLAMVHVPRDATIDDMSFPAEGGIMLAWDGHRPVRAIRLKSFVRAELVSERTGQTMTVGISESREDTIKLDGATYYVVDIRPGSTNVVLQCADSGALVILGNARVRP